MDYGHQYTQGELPSDVFNSSNGDIRSFNGQQVKVTVNDNGTRTLSPYTDTSSYDNLLGSVKDATSNFASQVNQNENNAFKQYLDVVQGQPTSVDFYNKQLEQAGVPQLRQSQKSLQDTIYGLEDTLRRVEPNVDATTKNSIVTNAQRSGMIEARQKPLIEDLGWLNQSLGRLSSAISEATGQALTLTNLNAQDQQKIVDAYKIQLDLATKQGDRALQAFSQDIDNVLNVTLAKIHRGEQVSDTEAANAFELLKLQKTAELNMQAEEAKMDTEVVTVGGRKILLDKKTGKTIADLGSSSEGGSGSSITTSLTKPTFTPGQATTSSADLSKYVTDYSKILNQPISLPGASTGNIYTPSVQTQPKQVNPWDAYTSSYSF